MAWCPHLLVCARPGRRRVQAVQKLLTIGQRLADVRKAMEPAVTAAVDDLLAKLEGCEDNYTVAESRFVAAATKNPDLMAVFVAV